MIARPDSKVYDEYALDESVFRQPGKSRTHSEARAMAALIIQNLEGITLTELSRAIGRELSALSQAAGRLRKRMIDNKRLQEKVKPDPIAPHKNSVTARTMP